MSSCKGLRRPRFVARSMNRGPTCWASVSRVGLGERCGKRKAKTVSLHVFRSPHLDPVLPGGRLDEFLLGRWAAEPERVALIDGESNRRLSFGELTRMAERLAATLRRRGLAQGDV